VRDEVGVEQGEEESKERRRKARHVATCEQGGVRMCANMSERAREK
jgi:hypothetical protein